MTLCIVLISSAFAIFIGWNWIHARKFHQHLEDITCTKCNKIYESLRQYKEKTCFKCFEKEHEAEREMIRRKAIVSIEEYI